MRGDTVLFHSRRNISDSRRALRRSIVPKVRPGEGARAPSVLSRDGAHDLTRNVLASRGAPRSAPRKQGRPYVYRIQPPWRDTPVHPFLRDKPAQPSPRAKVMRDKAILARAPVEWQALPADVLRLTPVEGGLDPETVPVLLHGLDKVLREPGVHSLVDVKQGGGRYEVLGGDAGLREVEALHRVVQPDEIDWTRIPPYIPATEDEALRVVARREDGVRYVSSTSSFTGMLQLLYHGITNFGDTLLNGGLSRKMADLPQSFTKFHKKAQAITVRPFPSGENMFSIGAHQGMDTSSSILRDLGHTMERMVTMGADEFREKLMLKDGKEGAKPVGFEGYMEASADEAKKVMHDESSFYHYSRADQFLLRAQIDARDAENGNVFDLKSRASSPIRYAVDDYLRNSHKPISYLTGCWLSYEREFYDMVRSVFLKYALQLRIGRMSGAFVTYHNTSAVMGFEFLSLREMEAYVFGGKKWADIAFSSMVRILGVVLDEVTEAMPVKYPGYLKIVVVPHSSQRYMDVIVQRVTDPKNDALGVSVFSPLGPRSSRQRKKKEASTDFDDCGENDSYGGFVEADDSFNVDTASASSTDEDAVFSLPDPGNRHAKNVNSEGESIWIRREAMASQLFDDVSLNLSVDDVRCWRLKMSPNVNGARQTAQFVVGLKDKFSLDYNLQPHPMTEHGMKQHLFTSLDTLYNG